MKTVQSWRHTCFYVAGTLITCWLGNTPLGLWCGKHQLESKAASQYLLPLFVSKYKTNHIILQNILHIFSRNITLLAFLIICSILLSQSLNQPKFMKRPGRILNFASPKLWPKTWERERKKYKIICQRTEFACRRKNVFLLISWELFNKH